MKDARLRSVSILRGWMLCYIIMGHIGFTGIFDYYIHAFHVPIFFVLSGYCFREGTTVGKYILKKVKTMLVPYVVFALIHFGLAFVLVEDFNWQNSLRVIFWKNNSGMPISGSLWFVTSIFFASVFYKLLDVTVKGWFKSVLIAVIMVLGFLCPVRLPYSMDTALVGVGFMHVGHLIRIYEPKKKWLEKSLNLGWIFSLIVLILNAGAIICNDYINMRKMIYGIWPLFIVNVILAFWAYFNLAKLLDKIQWPVGRHMVLLLEKIGIYSIYFLAFNELGIKLWNLTMPSLESENFVVKLIYKFSELGIVILFIFILCCAFEFLKKVTNSGHRK